MRVRQSYGLQRTQSSAFRLGGRRTLGRFGTRAANGVACSRQRRIARSRHMIVPSLFVQRGELFAGSRLTIFGGTDVALNIIRQRSKGPLRSRGDV